MLKPDHVMGTKFRRDGKNGNFKGFCCFVNFFVSFSILNIGIF